MGLRAEKQIDNADSVSVPVIKYPSERSSRGEGLNIAYGVISSNKYIEGPELVMAWTQEGLCWTGFSLNGNLGKPIKQMASHFPKAEFVRNDVMAERALGMPLVLYGTDFQLKVWEELLCIPQGKTSTYSAIAGKIGKPKAARAVGSAVGSNPISLLVPCHRVIREDGNIDGYLWGTEVKKKLLKAENSAIMAEN